MLRDGQNVRDVMLESSRAEEVLGHLSKYEYASRPHVVLTLMWHTMMRTSAVHSLDVDEEGLREQAAKYGLEDKIDALLRYLETEGEVNDKRLPEWDEFQKLAADYKIES